LGEGVVVFQKNNCRPEYLGARLALHVRCGRFLFILFLPSLP